MNSLSQQVSNTEDQWKYNSGKNEKTESKQNHHPVVDVTGDGGKV